MPMSTKKNQETTGIMRTSKMIGAIMMSSKSSKKLGEENIRKFLKESIHLHKKKLLSKCLNLSKKEKLNEKSKYC